MLWRRVQPAKSAREGQAWGSIAGLQGKGATYVFGERSGTEIPGEFKEQSRGQHGQSGVENHRACRKGGERWILQANVGTQDFI